MSEVKVLILFIVEVVVGDYIEIFWIGLGSGFSSNGDYIDLIEVMGVDEVGGYFIWYWV